MATSFASVHFIGEDTIDERYVDLIKPNIPSGVFLGFDMVEDIEILAVKSGRAVSLFCEDLGMESIDETVCKSYKDESIPAILTAGILDGDVISVSIIQNGKVISNITLRDRECPEDVYEDIKEQWCNVECFEKLFGVSRAELEKGVCDDMLDTLCNWAELINIPFAESYYSAEESFESSEKKKFFIKSKDIIKNAKIISIDDFTNEFLKHLDF